MRPIEIWKMFEEDPVIVETDKGLIQYDKKGNKLGVYKTFREASEKTGVSISCISQNVHGKTEYAGGYKWKVFH